MARISEHFRLHRDQPSLDFVDIEKDLRVFVDPRALRLLPTDWGHEYVAPIQDFSTVMTFIREGNDSLAKRLLQNLRKPNESHLGLSIAESRGRALGHESAGDVWEALSQSEAALSSLLEDLEDTVLLESLLSALFYPSLSNPL